jgi:hypothetical protein
VAANELGEPVAQSVVPLAAPPSAPNANLRGTDKVAAHQPSDSGSETVLDRRLTEYVQDIFLKDQESYAAQVDYYDQGIVNRNAVLQGKAAYARRWPQRAYDLVPGSLIIMSQSEARVTLSFSYKFKVANGTRIRSGLGATTLQLQTTGGQIEVVGVKERVQR